MNKAKIVEALNADRADELGSVIQYMGHHYTAEGLESPAVIELFKKTAIDEMRHAERLAERIVYLGGQPTQKPSPSRKGGELAKMVQDDLAGENQAIGEYRSHIRLCVEVEDPTTRLMLEEILSDEEGHADQWETILKIRK